MHHADTRTFLRYYLSRRINKNLPAIIRGLNLEDDIMRAACRMSRSIDPNRPQELTTAQSSSVNQDPEIVDLVRRRDALSRQMGRPLSNHYGTEQYTIYKKLNQEIAGARQRARNALLTPGSSKVRPRATDAGNQTSAVWMQSDRGSKSSQVFGSGTTTPEATN